MALVFPIDCNTPAKRTEYCYRALELLKRLHNGMGKWYREGLTQTQWDKFPQKIRNRYPYTSQLSKGDWHDFVHGVFEPIMGRITGKMLEQRALLSASTTWDIAVEDI